MNKIKELARRIECALLGYQWIYDNATRFNIYLSKALKRVSLFHLRRKVKAKIDAWTDVDASQKRTILAIVDNMLPAPEGVGPVNDINHMLKVDLTLRVAKCVVQQLGGFIGIQPMSCPVGMVYLLQYKEEVQPEQSNGEGRKVSIQVVSQAVEASTRRLNAGWSIEAMQDLNSIHGLDIAREIEYMISDQIVEELVAEVLSDLKRLGPTIDISDKGLIALSVDPYEATNVAKILESEIIKTSNSIAHRTRRGRANSILVNPVVLSILQHMPSYIQITDVDFNGPTTGIMRVGTLKSINASVYLKVDQGEEILLAYKGNNSDIDTGYVYCPYIPILSSGMIVNPITYQPVMSLMTRYGKTINGSTEEAGQFYRTLKLDPLESKVPEPSPESDKA